MIETIFIGDELSATGFRLAGIETVVMQPSNVAAGLAQLRTVGAELIIVTAELARHIPAADLESAMRAETPVIAIVPDVLFRAVQPDVVGRLRRALGLEE